VSISYRLSISNYIFIIFFIVFCSWCGTAHRFHLPRLFFTSDFGDHLVLYDKSNSTKTLTVDIHLRYMWWGDDRLVIMDPSHPEKVLYKVICQVWDHCHILGWTRNRTDVTTLASLNTMAWHPYPTRDDPSYYDPQQRDIAADIIKSNALLKQPLLISTELFDEVFNITFFPTKKKYTIAYSSRHILAEVSNFNHSTPQYDHDGDYSLHIFEDINPKVDPAFLVSICIMIDYLKWPYYLPTT
jgi:hypothetical protein